MDTELSLNNESFSFLNNSSDFLNILLEEITSCVLLLNKDMKLYAYNDSLKTMFSDKPDEEIILKRCGNVIGCAYAVEELEECGNTSYCDYCVLREKALISYASGKPVSKQRLDREFYINDNEKVMKHLEFSTRLFKFQKEEYIVLIIDDITEFVKEIEMLSNKISRLENEIGKSKS